MIAHLVLRVTDIERSRSFYGALGLEFVAEKHGTGPRHYACHEGATVLELYPQGERPPSTIRLGLRVESVRLVETELRGLGRLDIVARDAATQILTIRDPDGNTVDLIERSANAAT